MELEDVNSRPIGFFDTGVGGISVLKKTLEILPNEDYIYFGDSKNAPYGVRPLEEVKKLTFNAIQLLLDKGCKAIVVACNTATSAAIEDLRKEYKNIPIIGIEPALKPAIEMRRKGKILIMATPLTLAEKKFSNLVKVYAKDSVIEPVPCAGLVEIIEKGTLEGKELNKFLKQKLAKNLKTDIAAIVLGCTHYPFIKKELQKVVGKSVSIIDGSEGTARELKRKLEESGLINTSLAKGKIEILNSSEEEFLIRYCYKLLELKES